jgi:hypothetical protein
MNKLAIVGLLLLLIVVVLVILVVTHVIKIPGVNLSVNPCYMCNCPSTPNPNPNWPSCGGGCC